MSTDDRLRRLPPKPVRIAGAIAAVQGAVAVIVAVILIIRGLAGHHEEAISNYGTAGWFGIIGGGVLAGGIALLTGRRWGRAIALVAQLLLLPVAYYLSTSHLTWIGVPLGLVAIGVLVLLFAPATVAWVQGEPDGDA